MTMTRRAFLLTVSSTAAGLALPILASPVSASCASDDGVGRAGLCAPSEQTVRPPGDPPFDPWWVKTHLATLAWPTAHEVNSPVLKVPEDAHLRVDGSQRGYRLLVWDARSNQHFYIGAEAVGPVDPPTWSAFADDGRWIDVNLSLPQHLRAMQGDEEVFRDLVTAGIQGRTSPGFYRIIRRVANETMDSRTVPDATRQYLLKDVLYTQYFLNDGSAIHYNWWASTWGSPGSQGCLGMRLAGAKYMWDWANIGTPVVIHR